MAAAAEQATPPPPAATDEQPPAPAALLLELPPPPLPPGRVLRRAFARAGGGGSTAAAPAAPTAAFPRVYVLMHGAGRTTDDNAQDDDPESNGLTPRLLDELRALFAAAAAASAAGPTLDLVPLLPFAGWRGADSVAALPDARAVLSLRRSQGAVLASELNARRQQEGAAALEALDWEEEEEDDNGGGNATAAPSSPPSSPPLLSFPDVAVGGTFDRLHAGHRLLLAATALAARERVFAGVTADALLAGKARRELLQPYAERAAAAESYSRRVRPSLQVRTGALRDPKEPTQAELDPDMRALVVSRETVRGGEAINEGRRARGFAPLELVVVGLVGDGGGGGGGGGDDDGGDCVDVAGKISSTALREQEAMAAEAAAARGDR
jgi:phosphopantetheine adenylyltransferase